jgi:cell division protein FtsQ
MRTREPAPMLSTRAMQRAARLMLVTSAVLLLVGAAGWLIQRPWFDLRQIEVRAAEASGLRHVNANAARAAAVGRLSGNFFTMRLEEARRVFETVPWVAAVSLRRAWPDRLVVMITEHRAIAVWDDGRLLADSGQLFVANVAEAEVYGPLPQIDAPPRFGADVARRLPQLAAWARSLGLALEAIELSDRASWTLRTESGLAIEVGRDDPPGRLDERLALIATHYPAMAAQAGGEMLRIDARYPQGFAVAAAARRKP